MITAKTTQYKHGRLSMVHLKPFALNRFCKDSPIRCRQTIVTTVISLPYKVWTLPTWGKFRGGIEVPSHVICCLQNHLPNNKSSSLHDLVIGIGHLLLVPLDTTKGKIPYFLQGFEVRDLTFCTSGCTHFNFLTMNHPRGRN